MTDTPKFTFQDDYEHFSTPKFPFEINLQTRRSFPNLQALCRQSSFTEETMATIPNEFEEYPQFLCNFNPQQQLPFPEQHDPLPEDYKRYQSDPEVECAEMHLFKLVNADPHEVIVDENGERIQSDVLKNAITWPMSSRQMKCVYINKNQFNVIMKRRKKRLEKLRNTNLLLQTNPNSATGTINSQTNSVVNGKKNYKYESRHKHAQNRKRDENGKFIKQAKTEKKPKKETKQNKLNQLNSTKSVKSTNSVNSIEINVNKIEEINDKLIASQTNGKQISLPTLQLQIQQNTTNLNTINNMNNVNNMLNLSMIESVNPVNGAQEDQIQQEITQIFGNDQQQIGLNYDTTLTNDQTITEIQNLNEISYIPFPNQMNGMNQLSRYSSATLSLSNTNTTSSNTLSMGSLGPISPMSSMGIIPNHISLPLNVEQIKIDQMNNMNNLSGINNMSQINNLSNIGIGVDQINNYI